jgi:hypothetical protein
MILLTSTGPALRRAIGDGLTSQGEELWPVLTGSTLELVLAAWGCGSLVYVAGASMLEGCIEPRPSEERARQVLLAAAMPGVELVVAVVPSGEHYAAEEHVLRDGPVPVVTLRCAPLLEEVDATPGAIESMRDSGAVTTGAMLSSTLLRALHDVAWRGRTIEVPTLRRATVYRAARASLPHAAGLPALSCVG